MSVVPPADGVGACAPTVVNDEGNPEHRGRYQSFAYWLDETPVSSGEEEETPPEASKRTLSAGEDESRRPQRTTRAASGFPPRVDIGEPSRHLTQTHHVIVVSARRSSCEIAVALRAVCVYTGKADGGYGRCGAICRLAQHRLICSEAGCVRRD